jgi:uncharacterized protein
MSIHTIILPFRHSEADLREAAEHRFGAGVPYRILKRSIDARQHRNIRVEYSVTTEIEDPVSRQREDVAAFSERLKAARATQGLPRAVVVGSGPGGMFCAYWLHLHGVRVILLEQGPPMSQRIRDMARFMKAGDLNPYSNICFGAGGAGTYSDGKLITRIRSPYIGFVMATFVEHGAPEEIRYIYNPHLGSNRIRHCIAGFLSGLAESGMDIRYETRFTGFEADDSGVLTRIHTSNEPIEHPAAVFLASGHSSRATYALLRSQNVAMDIKEFAAGVRVEHPSAIINEIQYGKAYKELYPEIETAQYKLAHTWKEERRAAYSFCMCPGGYVLNATTDLDAVVTNGMSNALKRGRFSNAAIVVNISRDDLRREGYNGIDGAMELQKELESRFCASVNAAGRCNIVPGQRLGDFLEQRPSRSLTRSSCTNPIAPAPMHTLFPAFIGEGLRRAFGIFDRKMRGFGTHPEAQVFGIESRTSAPYRILRDEFSLQSPTHPNLYPVGEGAGFAGGITSAAVDGIRCAQAFLEGLL